jgi:hypothetical protein
MRWIKAFFHVLLVAIILNLGGCATGPKIDWQSRVGNYTFDDAVLELGPPDKMATLQDGVRVAEWLTARGLQTGGTFYSVGRMVHHVPDPQAPDYFIRLTFDPEGKLTAYKRVVK